MPKSVRPSQVINFNSAIVPTRIVESELSAGPGGRACGAGPGAATIATGVRLSANRRTQPRRPGRRCREPFNNGFAAIVWFAARTNHRSCSV